LRLPEAREPEKLAQAINAAAGKAIARRENRRLQESLAERPYEALEGIVGVSPAIRKIVERIKKAARNKLTVLILGETGTGKDVIAEAIHKQSDRAAKPMKSVNCAGLNENLLESELFGHVRGAFTGAVSDRKVFRGGGRRHPVPGRDWRHAAQHAGEAPAGPGTPGDHAGRVDRRPAGGRTRDGGDAHGPATVGRGA
jgi:hypothetical protein